MVDTTDFPTLSAARDLWGRQMRPEALDAFEQATKARPRNLKALMEAARAFGAAFYIEKGEALLDRAHDLVADAPQALLPLVQSYARIHREAKALDMLLAIPNRSPPAIAELASLYEGAGRLREAKTEIERCIAAVPAAPEPRLARGRILRRMGEDALAREALVPLTDPRLDLALRAEAWTELCYIADRAGDTSEAVTSIEMAHRLLREQSGTSRLIAQARANNQLVARLASDLDTHSLKRWRAAAPCAARVAHLVGFPRSGTTLLEQWLDAHPDLVASAERAHFTTNILPQLVVAGGGLSAAQLNQIAPEPLDRLRSRYLDGMSEALGAPIGARLHLDKNPNHTGLIPALLRLHPEARFVVALRDPRDVITSCVLRSFRMTEFSSMLLDWGTAAELYAAEMGAWLQIREALPKDQWVETRYEDMVANPESEVTRVLTALGLGWHPDVAEWQNRTTGKFVNSPTQTEVRRPVYRDAVGRWRRYSAYLSPHLRRLAPFIDAFGYASK